jgi:hypothetical protein
MIVLLKYTFLGFTAPFSLAHAIINQDFPPQIKGHGPVRASEPIQAPLGVSAAELFKRAGTISYCTDWQFGTRELGVGTEQRFLS